jgi:large subunit ribosomal protein L22
MANTMLVRRIASLVLGRQQQHRMVSPPACFSTMSSNRRPTSSSGTNFDDVTLNRPSSTAATHVVTARDGRQFAIIDRTTTQQRRQKLKPSIVRRRIEKLRVYEGRERDIRHSPWRLNLVCQLAAGLPLLEALQQLDFCKKSAAPLVHKVLKRTSNLADIRHGLQPSQLEVAECFATHGKHLKRMKIMGRGRCVLVGGRLQDFHVMRLLCVCVCVCR